MGNLDVRNHPDLLVGLESPDDAGVYKLGNDIALIQTLDFLTPVTNDPYEFGQIAAANSLSDVYAMGGTPLTVMNIVCFPSCDMPEEVLLETLKGGQNKINESGATLVGGHSVDDDEFKYGLSVTGLVHPDHIFTNAGAKIGDAVILTKPVGTGILSTAVKAGLASEDQIRQGVDVMAMLNKNVVEVMGGFQIHSCTDVTGFGLAGHLIEMARGSKKRIQLFSDQVHFLNGVIDFAAMGMVPAGAHKNRSFFKPFTQFDSDVDRAVIDLIFDPQTSGGLLITLDKNDASNCIETLEYQGVMASMVGRVTGDHKQGVLSII